MKEIKGKAVSLIVYKASKMKRLLLLPLLFFCGIISAQQLEGAWKLTHKDGKTITDRETIKILQDDYFAYGTRESGSNEFIAAGGGEFFTDSGYIESYDFHTQDPEMVGTEKKYELQYNNERLKLIDPDGKTEIWQKISDEEDDLSGNWVITGRQRNGEMRTSTPGARRTIKILGGGRFQWVAFNSDTKEFHGTGGGTYTAEDGNYTENIEFFSRDDSRVGASLPFVYEVKDGEWHHSGKTSKGDPMYEIWSPYSEAYEKTE